MNRGQNIGDRTRKHGVSRVNSREYHAWKKMRQRCTNPKDPKFRIYGGRGIKIHESWNDFKTFLRDVGPSPSPSHSIDRFPDNNGNYEPGNVRWATPRQQTINRRVTIFVEHDGHTKTISEWAEQFGLTDSAIRWRLKNWARIA